MELLLAIVDLVPVILFCLSVIKLQAALYAKINKYVFMTISGGCFMVLFAGLLKALWKILYYGAKLDFYRFDHLFFPIQSLGFLLIAIGLVILIIKYSILNKEVKLFSISLPLAFIIAKVIPGSDGYQIYDGTMIFVVLQIVGSAVICASIAYFGVMSNKKIISLYAILSFICMLGMGYLSTKINRSTGSDYIKYNWFAEVTNIIGQGLLLLGIVKLLKKPVNK